jgi:plasmid stabilization system protein ParE
MATLSFNARQQARQLSGHFGFKDRPQARIYLRRAISQACIAADDPRLRTKVFPAAYPDLASLGFRWFKLHRYWFAIEETTSGNVIAAIFYDAADMPSWI